MHILPPYQKQKGSDWYTGTANAIYQNIPFIDRYDPEYVLILSGDHIYKMDYSKMLRFHKEKNADCTIAVIDVPMEEASRFGIMSCDEDMKIFQFEEKPKNPTSTLASMGIYIFNWKKLRYYLEKDENTEGSSKDFGKNIIPDMLSNNEGMFAYTFDSYWKDVGTIDSLWEANMDLINPNVPLELHDKSWKIYSRTPILPPHFIADTSFVQNSLVTEGSSVSGKVDFSVIFAGVTVEEGAEVRDSIVMPGAVIKKGAKINYSIIAENTVIGENASVGVRPEDTPDKDNWGVSVVGANLEISDNTVIGAKAMIDKNM